MVEVPRLLRINPTPSPSPSIAHISRPSPSMPTSSSAIRIPTITTFSTARTKAYQCACTHARHLKAQITERRVARKKYDEADGVCAYCWTRRLTGRVRQPRAGWTARLCVRNNNLDFLEFIAKFLLTPIFRPKNPTHRTTRSLVTTHFIRIGKFS